MTSVLFLVQFENFDQTMGFYWSYMYMLTLQLPVLMRSCITVSLISLPHSLLSPHSLVRCVSREGSKDSGKPTQGHQFGSTKCKYSIILSHMQHFFCVHCTNVVTNEVTEVYSTCMLRSLTCKNMLSLCFAEEQPLGYDGLVTQKDQFSKI